MRFLVLVAMLLVAAPASANDLRTQFDAFLSGPAGLAAYKTYFPDQYAASLDRLVAGYDGNGATATRAGFSETRRFLKDNAANIAAAPAEDLLAHAVGQRDLLTYLRANDVTLCAQIFTGSYVYAGVQRSPDLLQRLSASQSTLFRAALHGIDRPQPRVHWQLSDTVLDAWVTKLAELGITERQGLLFDDAAALAAATPTEQCDVGVLMFRSISLLPAETAATVTAFLVYHTASS